VAPPLLRGRALAKQRLFGLVFLAVLAGLVLLTVAMYQKAFADVITVTLETDRIGNQLSKGGDVKARGVVVGEIRGVSSTGNGAQIELAIQSDEAGSIPADVTAQLLPKTLFGEKYVALDPDLGSSAPPLQDGDVIGQDQSETAREFATALDNLLPLLQTLKPQQLSITLNALSSALRGRGDQLGENLEIVDAYLQEFNPELGRLEANNRGLADYADILDEAAPDILRLLENSAFLSRSLVDQEQELNTFLTATTGFTDEMAGFLAENEQRFITLAADSLPNLQVLARYSPEFPCLAEGLAIQGNDSGGRFGEGTIGDVFGGLQPGLHITLEFTEDQGGYRNGDQPRFGEDRGPTCFGLEGEPIVPFPVYYEPEDGYCDEFERENEGVQAEGCHASESDAPQPHGASASPASVAADPARALAPRDLDRAAVAAAVGPVLGVAPRDVPDLAVLLFGPVARGTTVALTPGG
jgi:phospholipid/cholesterol/gamma-HCH transport system substrate-binding protein